MPHALGQGGDDGKQLLEELPGRVELLLLLLRQTPVDQLVLLEFRLFSAVGFMRTDEVSGELLIHICEHAAQFRRHLTGREHLQGHALHWLPGLSSQVNDLLRDIAEHDLAAVLYQCADALQIHSRTAVTSIGL